MKKKDKKPETALALRGATFADLGKVVLRDASVAVQDQVQRTIQNIAEHVIARQRYYMNQIEENKHWLAEFRRKEKAIADGEFSVNRLTGFVTFNDDTLNKLG